MLFLIYFNLILQDADGNTPLHVAVQGSYEMIEMLISSGRIDWELRNKERLNVFLSAISTDALKYGGLYKHVIEPFTLNSSHFLIGSLNTFGRKTGICCSNGLLNQVALRSFITLACTPISGYLKSFLITFLIILVLILFSNRLSTYWWVR